MIDLTAKQRQVLDCIKRMTAINGYPPTRQEIATAMGFNSANSAEEHIQALARKGALRVSRGIARGLSLA